MISIEASGVPYEGVISASVTTAMDSLSGVFNIVTKNIIPDLSQKISKITVVDGLSLPFKIGEEVSILVDGQTVLTGYIDDLSSSYSSSEHTVSVRGVDRTDDILTSTASEKVEFSTKISFENLIKKTLETNNIGNIKVINQVTGLADFEPSEIESPEIGGRLFDFFLELARKKKVLISTDGLGNLLILRSSTIAISDKLLNTVGESNIHNGSFTLSHKQRFGKYVVFSQGNMTGENGSAGSVTASSMAGRRGESRDLQVRLTKVMNMVSDKTQTTQQCIELAQWEQNVRRTRGYVYNCNVIGHSRPSGGIWKPNTLVFVQDIFSGLNSNMLINSVTYSQASGANSLTSLSFVSPDAYQIQADEPKAIAKSSTKAKNQTPTCEELNVILKRNKLQTEDCP